MNAREKRLAVAVGVVASAILAVVAGRAVFVKPLRVLDGRIVAARGRLERIHGERRAYFAAEDRMKSYGERTFADAVDLASARSGEVLTRILLQSGLNEDDFTRLPVGPRKLRGASEIGWNVQGDGPLAKVVNLVFLLEASKYLHRIEGLTLSAGDNPGEVRVRFRYLTLVLEPAPDVRFVNHPPEFSLDSPQRRIHDSLVARDLLRPYLRRAPVAPAAPPVAPGTAPAAPAVPGPEMYRIVSLSEWMGQPEVHVRELATEKTVRYRPGDVLAGGRIVCIDYRSRSLPGGGPLRSDSRVILKIDSEYWAIERGKTLADRRRLQPEELPASLAGLPR